VCIISFCTLSFFCCFQFVIQKMMMSLVCVSSFKKMKSLFDKKVLLQNLKLNLPNFQSKIMVATVLASAFAKSEAANVVRRHVVDQSQQVWSQTNFTEACSSAAASASQSQQHAQQQATSFVTENAQKLYEFLVDLLQGATTNIRRTVFGSATGGAGAHAICSAESKLGTTTAFTHEQEHFLSGIISFLHNEHASALEKAQRRTYLLCGITATASIAAAIASSYYFFVYRPRQEKMNKQKQESAAASDDVESSIIKNKILIKKLNFKGDSDALVSLLSRIKNLDSSSSEGGEASFIEIEEAVVSNSNDDDEDSNNSPVNYYRRNRRAAGGAVQNSTFTVDYYDDVSSTSGAQSRTASDVY
jgi:hypothetical protein